MRGARVHPILQPEDRFLGSHLRQPFTAGIASTLGAGAVDMAVGHPALGPDAPEPIRHAGDTTLAILFHMLLPNPADRDVTSRRVRDCQTERPFGLKNALRVMAQRTMGEERHMRLGRIEPCMDGLVVGWVAAKFSG